MGANCEGFQILKLPNSGLEAKMFGWQKLILRKHIIKYANKIPGSQTNRYPGWKEICPGPKNYLCRCPLVVTCSVEKAWRERHSRGGEEVRWLRMRITYETQWQLPQQLLPLKSKNKEKLVSNRFSAYWTLRNTMISKPIYEEIDWDKCHN